MTLRDHTPAALKRRVRSTLAAVGVEIGAYTGSFAQHRDDLLRAASVATAWDVGANLGQYAEALRRGGFQGRVISIEPGAAAFRGLWARAQRDNGWIALRTAVAESAGERVLHVSRNGQSSSLLPMLARHLDAAPDSEITGEETVCVTTLDDLRADSGAPPPYFLKLDLQGGELAALSGASRLLQQTSACEVEISLAALYEGAPTWEEVTAHLRAAGFMLCDLERVFFDRASHDLLQVNALFRRAAARRSALPEASRRSTPGPGPTPTRAA